MKCVAFLLAGVLLPLVSAGQVSREGVFGYDRSASLGVVAKGEERRGAALVSDLEFNPAGEVVKAYVVRPAEGKGPFAGILYVHWLGEPTTSNRTQFLDEAVELAGRGVLSVLVDAPWSKPTWYKDRIPEQDYVKSIQQVIAQRRAMDLLLMQPGLDASRVALVAHDFGAMYGMLAESCDRRAKTYVFMAPTPHFVDWFLFARQPQKLEPYKLQISALDPVLFVGSLAPAPVLYQFASKDYYVSAEEAAEFVAATKGPKEVRTYEAEHDLRVPQARVDRMAWLVRELGL